MDGKRLWGEGRFTLTELLIVEATRGATTTTATNAQVNGRTNVHYSLALAPWAMPVVRGPRGVSTLTKRRGLNSAGTPPQSARITPRATSLPVSGPSRMPLR